MVQYIVIDATGIFGNCGTTMVTSIYKEKLLKWYFNEGFIIAVPGIQSFSGTIELSLGGCNTGWNKQLTWQHCVCFNQEVNNKWPFLTKLVVLVIDYTRSPFYESTSSVLFELNFLPWKASAAESVPVLVKSNFC